MLDLRHCLSRVPDERLRERQQCRELRRDLVHSVPGSGAFGCNL
jgi:hypothetical protein